MVRRRARRRAKRRFGSSQIIATRPRLADLRIGIALEASSERARDDDLPARAVVGRGYAQPRISRIGRISRISRISHVSRSG